MLTLALSSTSTQRLHDAWKPSSVKNEALGLFMLGQVEERFFTQGASSGTPWAPKKMKSWGYDDGRSILTGHSAVLRKSFLSIATRNGASVLSTVPYAAVHQHGATIVPKQAKALFIPITDRAITAQTLTGGAAGRARSAYGMRMSKVLPMAYSPALKVATRGPKLARDPFYFRALVPGRLKDGKLQKKTRGGEYVDGTPDFIFLSKVKIPARPMLPTSPREQAAQRDFVLRTWGRMP